jgi:Beta-propeller repeat
MNLVRARTNLRRRLAVCALLLPTSFALFLAAQTLTGKPTSSPVSAAPAKPEIFAAYGKLPLVFEKNLGQTDSQVKFLAHARGYTLFLTEQGAVLRLSKVEAARASDRTQAASRPKRSGGAVVRLTLSGSDSPRRVEGLEAQPGHTNYFIGQDPSRWRTNVPIYARVKYHDVYPGIDAVYYGHQNRLETDYIVAPRSDPSQIALLVEGGRSVRLNSEGDLEISSAAGDLILRRPEVYQEIGGARSEISARYVERGENLIGIRLGPYDSREPVVVDPVLDYSTYLGGTGGEFLYGVAADSQGNAYITGDTNATDFPVTSNAYQTTFSAGPTAFITEINPTGTALVFSTFLGGSSSGEGDGIAVDPSGNIYVAGTTTASDFPVTATSAYQVVAANGGAFLTELAPGGSSLEYSTYLAGSTGVDNAVGVAIALNPNDNAYNAYVLGRTADTDFPITPGNAYQTSNNTNQTNPNPGTNFLSRIDPTQTGTASLVYSSYLGGSAEEFPTSIAVDATENAYLTGSTQSSDFPVTTSAFLSSRNNPNGDAFVSRIDTTASGQSSLIYSTYFGGKSDSGTFGGNSFDTGGGIAVQPNSIAVVVGYTYALAGDFPLTANALETASDSPSAIAFLSRFDTTQSGPSSLLYSSTWGGSTTDLAFGVTLDAAGNI